MWKPAADRFLRVASREPNLVQGHEAGNMELDAHQHMFLQRDYHILSPSTLPLIPSTHERPASAQRLRSCNSSATPMRSLSRRIVTILSTVASKLLNTHSTLRRLRMAKIRSVLQPSSWSPPQLPRCHLEPLRHTPSSFRINLELFNKSSKPDLGVIVLRSNVPLLQHHPFHPLLHVRPS